LLSINAIGGTFRQDKIRAEAARVYGDDPNATITYAQSKELLFTKMTICEALRLYPVSVGGQCMALTLGI